MVYGLWFMVYDLGFMVYGLGFVVCVACSMVSGVKPNLELSTLNPQPPTPNPQPPTRTTAALMRHKKSRHGLSRRQLVMMVVVAVAGLVFRR